MMGLNRYFNSVVRDDDSLQTADTVSIAVSPSTVCTPLLTTAGDHLEPDQRGGDELQRGGPGLH